MGAARSLEPQRWTGPRDTTLLALVQAITQVTKDDREVVATVLHMLRSGEVRLCGNFRGVDPEDLA